MNPSKHWWEYDDEDGDTHTHVIGDFRMLASASCHNERVAAFDAYTSLYHDRRYESDGLDNVFFSGRTATDRRARMNVIRSATKTVHSAVIKNRPRPMFLSSGGSTRERLAAESTTDYFAALYERQGAWQKLSRAVKDALIWGTGILRVRPFDSGGSSAKGLPTIERVYPHDVLVDEREAQYGCVQQMFIQHLVPRARLRAMFPDSGDIVDKAGDDVFDAVAIRSSERKWSDLVRVIEAWHLPSAPKAGDGRKVIVVSSGALWSGEWVHDDFGIVRLVWDEDQENDFWGIGLASEMVGLFTALDDVNAKLEESHDLIASQVWLEQGSQVSRERINNLPWSVNTYSGTPPVFANPEAASADTYRYEQLLYDRSFEMAGIHPRDVMAETPSKLQSGIAIQLHSDQKAGRLMEFSQDYERVSLDLARILVRCLAESKPINLPSVSHAAARAKIVEFSEISDTIDELVVTLYPVSQLSSTPQGRIDQVKELLPLGLPPEAAMELIGFPDLRSYTDAAQAGRRLVEAYIDRALLGQRPEPNPYLPVEYAIQRARDRLSEAMLRDVQDEDLSGLRAWISLMEKMQADRQDQAMAQQAAMAQQMTPPPGAETPPAAMLQ